MNVPKIEKETKGIDVEDLNVTFVFLDRGTYLIDDEIVSVDSYNPSKVQVKDFNNIKIVNTRTVPSHYTSPNGDMSIVDYEAKIEELTKNAIKDGGYCYFSDEFLDEEYEYKKFRKSWILIEKTIQTFSDPIKVEVEKIKYDTGNPFVQSAFLNNGAKDLGLYCYNSKLAHEFILEEYMNELGYQLATERLYDPKKFYKLDRTGDGIGSARIFGDLLFYGVDKFNKPYSKYGKLDDMIKEYEKDKFDIRDRVYKFYIKTFGKPNSLDIGNLISDLETINKQLSQLDVKIKSESAWKNVRNKLSGVIDNLYKNGGMKNE